MFVVLQKYFRLSVCMWLWTCLQDIAANKSIREALVYEENFFRSRPVSDPFLPCLFTH
jgi:hypothetical protein